MLGLSTETAPNPLFFPFSVFPSKGKWEQLEAAGTQEDFPGGGCNAGVWREGKTPGLDLGLVLPQLLLGKQKLQARREGIPGGAHPPQICWIWSGGTTSSALGERRGWKSNVYPGRGEAAFPNMPQHRVPSVRAVAPCQIPEFLSSGEQEEEGWASSSPDIHSPPPLNPLGPPGWVPVPACGNCLVADGIVPTPSRCPLLGSSWALGGTGGSLGVTFRAGLDWTLGPEHFELKVEESRKVSK